MEANKTLLCFHGSPSSFDDIILPNTSEEDFHHFLGGFDANLLAGGHTHTQQWRRLGNAWYVNPGSVGLAYNWLLAETAFRADPWAEYAIVTSEGERLGVEFLHLPFEVERLIEVYKTSGRPYSESAIAQYRLE